MKVFPSLSLIFFHKELLLIKVNIIFEISLILILRTGKGCGSDVYNTIFKNINESFLKLQNDFFSFWIF